MKNLARETIHPGEREAIADLIKQNLRTRWSDGGIPKRGQHGKHHGCVNGVFKVFEDLPENMAKGVFLPGQSYSCQVRFSNGGQQDDTAPDVRGMAIKLLGVEGKKLLPGQGHVSEQDFLLVDHPTYFSANMPDYVTFSRHFTPMQDLRGNGFSPGRALRAAYGLAMLMLFHRHLLRAAKTFAGRKAGSVLALRYHSATPYLLGADTAVKYACIGHADPLPPTDQPDGLRTDLWDRLGTGPQRFEFGVVVQDDASRQPIEDPSIDWEKQGARFVALAEIDLPRQTNSAEQDRRAENLIFSPWMCLPEHRPLGAINRARLQIYMAMSALRRESGDQDAGTPGT